MPKTRNGTLEQFVDVTITSPPYFDLKDHGFKGQIGYDQTYDHYLSDLEQIFSNVLEITKPTGSLWVVVDTFKWKGREVNGRYRKGELVLLPYDIAQVVRKTGWILRDIIIWHKDKTLPWSRRGQLRNIFEYILFFTKTETYKFHVDRVKLKDPRLFKEWWVRFPERYSPQGIAPTDVWNIPIPVQGSWGHRSLRHSCPFPRGLVERILQLSTDVGDVAFDPFAGSGVVLAVSEFMKRKWMGFELNGGYIEMFQKHVINEIGREMKKDIERSQHLNCQGKIGDVIKRLRLVKYPKVIVRELIKEQSMDSVRFPINTIVAISLDEPEGSEHSTENRWKFLSEKLYFLFDAPFDKQQLSESINIISQKAPASKFGINATFELWTRDEFIRSCRNGEIDLDWKRMWLYSEGVMYRYTRTITFRKWSIHSTHRSWYQKFKNGIPPVISNVSVKQSPPKTWSPKFS